MFLKFEIYLHLISLSLSLSLSLSSYKQGFLKHFIFI